MRKKPWRVLLATGMLAASAFGNSESLELAVGELQASSSHSARNQRILANDHRGYDRWIVSPGVGISIDPSAFLFTAQLEYVHRPYLFYGPFVEMIFPNGGVAFTGGLSVRSTLGSGRIRPSFEAGAGVVFANGGGTQLGFHLHFGIGAEYRLNDSIALATMLKPTFNPGVDNFWISWPLLIARFAL